MSKPREYREMIDTLVEMCHKGQGQIAARRVREGIWHREASPDVLSDYHKINLLLARLSVDDREIIASLLAQAVECGVFEALKVLEQYEVAPFETGYEGSPYNDFIGRLDDWEWPES